MRSVRIASVLLMCLPGYVLADDANSIMVIESSSKTVETKRKPGNVYVGEKVIYKATDPLVQIGVWEAGPSVTRLENYPYTEYCLMISGHLVITNLDGTRSEFRAGDTFVMPKGWTGVWDIHERMKKQFVKVGEISADNNFTATPVREGN